MIFRLTIKRNFRKSKRKVTKKKKNEKKLHSINTHFFQLRGEIAKILFSTDFTFHFKIFLRIPTRRKKVEKFRLSRHVVGKRSSSIRTSTDTYDDEIPRRCRNFFAEESVHVRRIYNNKTEISDFRLSLVRYVISLTTVQYNNLRVINVQMLSHSDCVYVYGHKRVRYCRNIQQ